MSPPTGSSGAERSDVNARIVALPSYPVALDGY